MREKLKDFGLFVVGFTIIVLFFIGAFILLNTLYVLFFLFSLFNTKLHMDLGRDVVYPRSD